MSLKTFFVSPNCALAKAEKIISLIASASNPEGITISEIEAKTGQSQTTVHRILNRVLEAGWIETRKLHGRSAYWCLSAAFIGLAFQWKRSVHSGLDNLGDRFMLRNQKPNSTELVNKSVYLFHLVVAGGRQGVSLDEVYRISGYPRTSVYRALCSWEQLGWLVSINIDGRSEKWFPSAKLVEVAHQYENQRRRHLIHLTEQYQQVTGEAL